MKLSSAKNNYYRYLFYTLTVIYCAWCALLGGDFDVFLLAADKLKNLGNIYNPCFTKGPECLQYYYSPFFALLLVPFTFLPNFVIEFIWLLLSAWWLYRIWNLSKSHFNTDFLTEREGTIWVVLSFLFILRFIVYNFSMIQVTIFLMWATLEGLALFKKEKHLVGGLLIALACNVKLLPIIFVPYLIYRSEWRGFIYTIFFFLLFLALPASLIGYDFNWFLLSEWWNTINPTNKEFLIEAGLGTHSLVAFIPVLITNTSAEFPFHRNFVNLDLKTVELILNLARLGFIVITLFFLRSLPFLKNENRVKGFWEYSYLFLVTPLLFPHQQKYAFIYVFPAIIYLTYFFIVTRKTSGKGFKLLLILFLLNGIVFTPIIGSDSIGRYFYDLLQYYRIITYSTLFLVAMLLICSPRKLNDSIANQGRRG
jgi:hypothetical protein